MCLLVRYSLILLALLIISSVLSDKNDDDDLYELLGVARDATPKDIRKAFKKLAIKLHPDKNQNDENADANFVKVARAYEVLKDPESRKQYDLFGDIDDRNNQQEFRSYTYYTEQFGIYDDDHLIVTLTRADFELNVVDTRQVWFVNFYSAQCHHCHQLAPTWRKLAVQLEGVIRIAAVNCEEDWPLCRQLGISSYPSLLYYEKESQLYEGEQYRGDRSLESLYEHIISRIIVDIHDVGETTWELQSRTNWLLFLCSDSSNCLETDTQKKLAAIFDSIMSVGIVEDNHLCEKLAKNQQHVSVVFWYVKTADDAQTYTFETSDSKEILNKILQLLPDPKLLTAEDFRDLRMQLRLGSEKPWLICFYLGHADDLNVELKRLPSWLPNMNVGVIHCGQSATLCSSLHISHYPAWGVLKAGGAFEIHHGRDISFEIVNFAKESSKATNLHSLSPSEFESLRAEKEVWFIDWYSPWCPPCRKLIPELRKASVDFNPKSIKFGTIDCTVHSNLCSREGIRAYPTTALYNGSQIKYFHGVPNQVGIVEFIDYNLHPTAIFLDDSSFDRLRTKPSNEIWIVDYFAPWCAPCNRLAPHWHTLAKQVAHIDFLKVAQVDCEQNAQLCNAQGVKGYPTIRLYPLESEGLNTIAIYNGYFDTQSIKRWLFNFLPSSVESLNPDTFAQKVLAENESYTPWLIDFYAPWCGHCVHFEPDFVSVAEQMKNTVKSGKVNCESENVFCKQLDISSYPTVILYASPSRQHKIYSQIPQEIIGEIERILSVPVRDEL